MEEANELDLLLEGDTAELKLKSAKEVILGLEKETARLRAEGKRSENLIKKLQDSASINGQNQNNTSSAFLLPSEFKKSWESFTMENILDLFSQFLHSPTEFVFLVQGLIKYILQIVKEEIASKLNVVCKVLGSEDGAKERVKKGLLKLFQDNYASAFPCPEAKKLGQGFINTLALGLVPKVKGLIFTNEFATFVGKMHSIAVHMLLNDPALELFFPDTQEYITIDRPDEYYYIDGFPLENPKGILVVPSVMRNSHPYANIKPSVLLIPKSDTDHVKAISDSSDADQDSYPPLQKKSKSFHKKECKNCKAKTPCPSCSKITLLALAKRIPNLNPSQRYLNRVQSNSSFDGSHQIEKTVKNVLARRLSEAARKMDKKVFAKKKITDKEACKVM